MWPFKNKKPKRKKPDIKPPVAIGERFKYLDIEMVCTKYWHPNLYCEGQVVLAEYVNNGEIKHICFSQPDWPSLKAECARRGRKL